MANRPGQLASHILNFLWTLKRSRQHAFSSQQSQAIHKRPEPTPSRSANLESLLEEASLQLSSNPRSASPTPILDDESPYSSRLPPSQIQRLPTLFQEDYNALQTPLPRSASPTPIDDDSPLSSHRSRGHYKGRDSLPEDRVRDNRFRKGGHGEDGVQGIRLQEDRFQDHRPQEDTLPENSHSKGDVHPPSQALLPPCSSPTQPSDTQHTSAYTQLSTKEPEDH